MINCDYLKVLSYLLILLGYVTSIEMPGNIQTELMNFCLFLSKSEGKRDIVLSHSPLFLYKSDGMRDTYLKPCAQLFINPLSK